MAECAGCGRALTADEAGLTKKLINRGTEKYYCVACLAAMFKVDESLLYEKIEQFRAQGCVLFAGPDGGVKPCDVPRKADQTNENGPGGEQRFRAVLDFLG